MKNQTEQARAILASYHTTPDNAAAALTLAAAMAIDYQTAAAIVAALIGG